MHKLLLNHFSAIEPLSIEEIAAIDETMSEKQFKKGDVLLKEGQASSEVFFVLKGIVRQYFIVDGVEKTSQFFAEGQWVLSTNSATPNTPSTHYLECCLDCILTVGNSEKGEALYKKFPNLETISRKLMQQVYIELQEKMEAFIVDAPQIRYTKLLKSNPELFQRIPQYQIASYIGVTPESLSRMKKRILKEG